MKLLTLSVLATTLFTLNANANVSAKSLGALENAVMVTSASTVLPVVSTSDAVVFSTFWPILGDLKEELVQVEADAYNFLAGEEISLALEAQINQVRELVPELASASDEEVCTMILEFVK